LNELYAVGKMHKARRDEHRRRMVEGGGIRRWGDVQNDDPEHKKKLQTDTTELMQTRSREGRNIKGDSTRNRETRNKENRDPGKNDHRNPNIMICDESRNFKF
jgi:hypothetical protein